MTHNVFSGTLTGDAILLNQPLVCGTAVDDLQFVGRRTDSPTWQHPAFFFAIDAVSLLSPETFYQSPVTLF